jgi:hypothetical protein
LKELFGFRYNYGTRVEDWSFNGDTLDSVDAIDKLRACSFLLFFDVGAAPVVWLLWLLLLLRSYALHYYQQLSEAQDDDMSFWVSMVSYFR